MTYILPVLYVIVSYTFFLLAGCFDNAIKLQILSILLPFIMGIVNLIVVLTVGRKWSRKTLLNCTLIIKYGLIPFYLVGGSITVYVTLMAFFPLPLMALFGLVTIFRPSPLRQTPGRKSGVDGNGNKRFSSFFNGERVTKINRM